MIPESFLKLKNKIERPLLLPLEGIHAFIMMQIYLLNEEVVYIGLPSAHEFIKAYRHILSFG